MAKATIGTFTEKISAGDELCDVHFNAKNILAQMKKIFSVDDVTRLDVDTENFLIDVETVPAKKISAGDELCDVHFNAKKILACADKLLGELSTTHAKTNGVHSGLLFDGEKILLVREDIGRHNVFDKIHGAALREKIFLGDKVLIFSGRCSSEMIRMFRALDGGGKRRTLRQLRGEYEDAITDFGEESQNAT